MAVGVAIVVAGVLAGCDSNVGIEGTDYHRDSGSAATQSAAPRPTTAAMDPVAPGPAPADRPAVTVALATDDAQATAAVGRWAADLENLTPAELEAKCWTMAPRNVDEMYSDKAAITAALARPGIDNGTAIEWKSVPGATSPVTVVAEHTDIATGYACPRVYPSGTEIGFGTSTESQTADARHLVRRYLARRTGHPLDAADQESTHPLLCASGTGWDPNGTGRAARAPLASNPNKLAAPTAFSDQSLSSTQLNNAYLSITATVTADGVQQDRTYTVKATEQGYCIGDVSA
ncbi:hypothetical protein NONO_c01100 [Nocardia nova SH22a]|uniref:Uncharacterized protein n=1 Tax=Nocardia nova SH22a TaxID=1415166 RepID=W5T6K2_9NOCA|nr:hypothetical protein [Nocardia nova]AHH14930.1 hypothetical protein NONO_c01100 [Nocardia nova SH22a]